MGSRTLRDKRKRINNHQRAKQAAADTAASSAEPVVEGQGALPDCVRKLFSSDYGEIEEGCSDVALFALDPETHHLLLELSVPQRLMQLLCGSPFDPAVVEALRTSTATAEQLPQVSTGPGPLVNAHKGILFFQTAAAQALRNLITNSPHDEAVDALERASAASAAQGSLLPGSGVLAAIQETAAFQHHDLAEGPAATANAVAALGRRLELAAVAQLDVASALAFLAAQTWELVQVARQHTNPADLVGEGQAATTAGEEDREGDTLTDAEKVAIEQAMNGDGVSVTEASLATMTASVKRATKSRLSHSLLYFTLLGHLDELLQLISVCIEGNERVAAYWSEPALVSWCLDTLQTAYTSVLDNVNHTAAYYTPLAESPETAAAQGGEEVHRAEMHAALRFFKRRETRLCADLLVSGGELIHVLSTDNAALAALLRGESKASKGAAKLRAGPASLSPAQQAFLNTVVSGATAMEALSGIASEDDALLASVLAEAASSAAEATTTAADAAVEPEQDATRLRLEYHAVVYQIVQFALSLQTTLLNVASSDGSIAKAMPLMVAVLQHTLPVHLWRTVALPLMADGCPVRETTRSAALVVVRQRLRTVHDAVKALHVAVSWICEQNSPDEDDEAAFARNPSAAILRQSNALYVFGLLLKDVLWLSATSAAGGADGGLDVMQLEKLKREQHALRDGAAGGISGEVSAVQFSILAVEVTVWGVSNMLLMMMPASQLGDQPALIWRAMIDAVRHRHELLVAAANAAHTGPADGVGAADSETVARGAVTHSPAARHMLWLQLESIVQILWTMQRKQAAAAGGPLESVNALEAQPADVDLLTRLAWEAQASPALQQASVGAVVGVCCALQSADAVAVAVRFALAMMSAATCALVTAAHAGASAHQTSSLSSLSAPWFAQSAPTEPTARHAWLAGLTALDGTVSVRCEAANTLVDVFSDERYDVAVYVPLGVHAALQGFLPQLRGYCKRRHQLTRDLQRHYRVVAEPVDAGQWQELTENLEGFLDYKRQNVR